MSTSSWRSFWLWAFVGAFAACAILAITSFGLYLLPFAVAAVLLTARRAHWWPEMIGVAVGVGLSALWGAWINWGLPRCSERSFTSLAGSGCTRVDSEQWLIVAGALSATGLVAYVLAARIRSQERYD